jgi:4-aminobutyrate aminotransferase-like enzyme
VEDIFNNNMDANAAARKRRQGVEQPVPRARFTLTPKPYNGPSAQDVLLARQTHLSAGQYHFYNKPLMLVEASMQYCFDDKGKTYVDCYSNVCHVGHCHPHFVASTSATMHDIISNTRYLHPTIVRYAEKLKSKVPAELSVCYFVNSGSEANDLAMRLARIHTQRKGITCLEYAYHGTTGSCTGVSTSLSTGTTTGTEDYKYHARDVYVAPVPDPYRGKYADDPEAGRKYAEDVKTILKDHPDEIAAFIHESVQGVGGQVVYPRDYLSRVYDAVRRDGGVCIADEVQTGFGRTGTHFWAFEAQGVVPDILTLGKPIGNGFPLGAVLTTREIARSFDGVQYFNTNGGNPVACSAGLAVLEIIERDGLQQNALEVSQYLIEKLHDLKEQHPIIGDVRGVGLFVGIELVRDRKTKEPAKDETARAMEKCRDNGVLIGKGGAFNNVLRMKPPLCFQKEDADFLVATLDVVLAEVVSYYDAKRQQSGNAVLPANHAETYVNCQSPTERCKDDGNDSDFRRRSGRAVTPLQRKLTFNGPSKRSRDSSPDTFSDDDDNIHRVRNAPAARRSTSQRSGRLSSLAESVLDQVPTALVKYALPTD